MADELKAHPLANLFPMMDEMELDALAEDIKENGLQQPIILYEKQVLDGRNRLAACKRAGVEPTFTDYEGKDPFGLVISLNAQRRDLTTAQRAIVAAKAMEHFPERRGRPGKQGKSSPVLPGRSRAAVATIFKVNDKYVQQAKAIVEWCHQETSTIAQEVLAKSLSLADAWERLEEEKKQKATRDWEEMRIAQEGYSEPISLGEVTWEEAVRRIKEKDQKEREQLKAEADARSHWLKEFAEHLRWFERSLHRESPAREGHLAWYTLPDAPGLFDHGITPERIAAIMDDLALVARVAFGDKT